MTAPPDHHEGRLPEVISRYQSAHDRRDVQFTLAGDLISHLVIAP